jgi:hypothetical protein
VSRSAKESKLILLTCLFVLFLFGRTAFAQPDNDDFVNATVLAGDGIEVLGTTFDATREPIGDPAQFDEASVWWKYVPTRSCTFRLIVKSFETTSKPPMPRLVVFRGDTLQSREALRSAEITTEPIVFIFRAEAGEPYALAAIAGRDSHLRFTLKLEALPGGPDPPFLSGAQLGIDGTTLDAEPPFYVLFPMDVKPLLRCPFQWLPGSGLHPPLDGSGSIRLKAVRKISLQPSHTGQHSFQTNIYLLAARPTPFNKASSA